MDPAAIVLLEVVVTHLRRSGTVPRQHVDDRPKTRVETCNVGGGCSWKFMQNSEKQSTCNNALALDGAWHDIPTYRRHVAFML